MTAEDQDEGTNADIVFSFVNEPSNNKFRINPNTGIVTAASSLAMESGKLFHLEVLARDKGNPPQSATGLIEIKVGESPEGAATLRFQNLSYMVHLPENAPIGREVTQVNFPNFLPLMLMSFIYVIFSFCFLYFYFFLFSISVFISILKFLPSFLLCSIHSFFILLSAIHPALDLPSRS